MKTIQMTIDEELLSAVDCATRSMKVTRSAFIREALHQALRQVVIHQLEEKHAAGYGTYPLQSGEFDVWQTEQLWEGE